MFKQTKEEMLADSVTVVSRVQIARLIGRSEYAVKWVIDNDESFPDSVASINVTFGKVSLLYRLSDVIAWDNARPAGKRYISDDGKPVSVDIGNNRLPSGERVYRQQEMADAAGISLSAWSMRVSNGQEPAPIIDDRMPWMYWMQEDFDRVCHLASFRYTVRDMTDAAQVSRPTLNKWIEQGKAPKPARIMGTVRYWSRSDYDQMIRIGEARNASKKKEKKSVS